jgi:hypothetical protein
MQSSSKQLISAGVAFLLVIILIATNPKESQLKEHLRTSLKEEAIKEGGFFGAIQELTAAPASWLMNLTTERKNYYLFSIYKTEGLTKNRKYIGILNTFFELPS